MPAFYPRPAHTHRTPPHHTTEPFEHWYNIHEYAPLFIFFATYLGIVRNKKIPHVARYHVMMVRRRRRQRRRRSLLACRGNHGSLETWQRAAGSGLGKRAWQCQEGLASGLGKRA